MSGSSRETIFTEEDEDALSAALLEKFPNAMILENRQVRNPRPKRQASIADCTLPEIWVEVPLGLDKPLPRKFPSEYDPLPDDGYGTLWYYRGANYPASMKASWKKHGRPPEIRMGVLHVIRENPIPEQRKFAAQVWRIFDRCVSYKLTEVAVPSRRPVGQVNLGRRYTAAGHHAILWAAAAPDRVFRYIAMTLDSPDKGCAIVPAPEAIAEARAAVLGEAAPDGVGRRRHAQERHRRR